MTVYQVSCEADLAAQFSEPEYEALGRSSRLEPVQVGTAIEGHEYKIAWLYRGPLYLADDDLEASDVAALVNEEMSKRQRRLRASGSRLCAPGDHPPAIQAAVDRSTRAAQTLAARDVQRSTVDVGAPARSRSPSQAWCGTAWKTPPGS